MSLRKRCNQNPKIVKEKYVFVFILKYMNQKINDHKNWIKTLL